MDLEKMVMTIMMIVATISMVIFSYIGYKNQPIWAIRSSIGMIIVGVISIMIIWGR